MPGGVAHPSDTQLYSSLKVYRPLYTTVDPINVNRNMILISHLKLYTTFAKVLFQQHKLVDTCCYWLLLLATLGPNGNFATQ